MSDHIDVLEALLIQSQSAKRGISNESVLVVTFLMRRPTVDENGI